MTDKKCRWGHPMTEKNTRWYKHSYNGKVYGQCRTCEAFRNKLRYWDDSGYRDRQRAKSRTYYFANRETAQ